MSSLYSNVTSRNATSPRTSGRGRRLASSSSSVAMRRISRMRSRPANASVICVPMLASWTIGTVMSAVSVRYITKSPMVMSPARIDEPPTSIIEMPISADDQRRERADRRNTGHRARDVAQEAMRALGEHELLALFRRVRLDDADTAEGFAEAPGHLGVDLAAFAEQRTQALERGGHARSQTCRAPGWSPRSAASSDR